MKDEGLKVKTTDGGWRMGTPLEHIDAPPAMAALHRPPTPLRRLKLTERAELDKWLPLENRKDLPPREWIRPAARYAEAVATPEEQACVALRYSWIDKPEKALDIFEVAMRGMKPTMDRDLSARARVLTHRARLVQRAGRVEDARAMFEEATDAWAE